MNHAITALAAAGTFLAGWVVAKRDNARHDRVVREVERSRAPRPLPTPKHFDAEPVTYDLDAWFAAHSHLDVLRRIDRQHIAN